MNIRGCQDYCAYIDTILAYKEEIKNGTRYFGDDMEQVDIFITSCPASYRGYFYGLLKKAIICKFKHEAMINNCWTINIYDLDQESILLLTVYFYMYLADEIVANHLDITKLNTYVSNLFNYCVGPH